MENEIITEVSASTENNDKGGIYMATFSIDLEGRVKNFDLPKNNPLLPLFEAIVNSIYAIEERQEKEKFEGKITIRINREPQIALTDIPGIDNSIRKIVGFTITDNGVGLDDTNMASFLQSDSTYRASKGGKGVGRFSWLKAFSKTHIESTYREDGAWVRREFDFDLSQKEIDDRLVDIEDATDNRTTVDLIDYYKKYQDYAPKQAITIATKIMNHCFIYLMQANCPIITVVDEDGTMCVNRMFEENIRREENSVKFEINGESFQLLHTRVQDTSVDASTLYLFANDRMVQSRNLEKAIVNLDKNLYKEEGYYYVGILSGKHLDDNVSTSRTSFDIDENGNNNEITMSRILDEACKSVKLYLADYLNEVKNRKDSKIQSYIKGTAPQFSHLLKYMPDEIDAIKPSTVDSPIKLDDELYRIKRKFDTTLRAENDAIMKAMDVNENGYPEYNESFKAQIQKISDANKAVLADYVAHRRVILELLRRGIYLKEDGKFNKESYIHNLIYPMRTTSEDVSYEAHNLWLIDERLSYCDYISSDITFKNDPNRKRTDILMLDRPVAVSDQLNNGREFETIIILELKKPMRDDYTHSENPIIQLLGYVDKLRSNTMQDRNGRPIKVGSNTQFYLYAVCDLTPKLENIAKIFNFKYTPDNRGMYCYNDNSHAYMEILSFDKLIEDAEKRNKILFDKLGI